jgi:hypothetical protein
VPYAPYGYGRRWLISESLISEYHSKFRKFEIQKTITIDSIKMPYLIFGQVWAAPPGSAAPAGRPRRASDLDDDPDDDLPIGRLRAGSGVAAGDGGGAAA